MAAGTNAQPSKTTKPRSLEDMARSPAPSNPFAPALSAAGKAFHAVATPIGNALDFQRHALAKAVTGSGDTDTQMERIRKMTGVEDAYQAVGHVPGVGHALQGAIDTGIQTVTDPLTYETLGFGPALKALGVAGKVGPAAMKAVKATAPGRMLYDAFHWGGPVARERGVETAQFVHGAANYASKTGERAQKHLISRFEKIAKGLTDEEKVTVGKALNGELAHEMVGTLTPKEQSAYRQLRTLTELDYKLRSDAVRSVVFQEATKDLPASDKAMLMRMLRRNKPLDIPEPMKRQKVVQPGLSVNQKTRLSNAHRPVQGPRRPGDAIPPQIAEPVDVGPGAYKMPRGNETAIQKAERLNALYHDIQFRVEKAMPKRQDYMPWAHYAEAEEGAPARAMNKLTYFDPHEQERPNVKVTAPEHLSQGFKAMAQNTGRRVEQGVLHHALGELVNDPNVSKLFASTIKATGSARTDLEKVKDAWLNFVGYPRAAVVSFTPRHAVNILDLLANTVGPKEAPAVLKETMALAAKLANPKLTEKEYAALTKEGREAGALSGSFRERQAFFQQVPTTRVRDLPLGEHAPKALQEKHLFGPFAGRGTGPLGAWTKLNNQLVWAVDEAAKQTYAKYLMKSGEAEGLRAGGLASARLVDYAHVPPIAKALKAVAPFGTFRGSIPGAVVGGIARNPARAAFLNRATGGTMYGGQPASGEQGVRFQGPTAEVGRMFAIHEPGFGTTDRQREVNARSGLGTYVRSTVGDLPKGVVSAAQDLLAPQEHPKRWATYGQPWLPKYDKNGKLDLGWIIDSAVAGVPQAQTMLDALGVGRFQWRGMAPEVLRQVLGVEVK